jgi:uncharacterized repeat protein (TIGR03803 family)
MQQQAQCIAFARRATSVLLALSAALFFLATAAFPAHSQTYKVIHNFTAKGSDGATPYGGPILDGSGNLYGTTYLGGFGGAGSVYKLSPSGSSWKYTSLYSFKAGPDGSGPAFGSLAIGANHGLFGTTEGGGNFGVVFAVCACVTKEKVIHTFGNANDGAQPIGGVVFDSAGNFYGTTSLGGAYGNGTVFKGTRYGQGWIENPIYSFTNSGSDPINPPAGVTLDAQGNIYGTASLGGASGNGAVYKLSHSDSGWTETVLYNFQALDDGANPVGGVIVDLAGNLYGTTFDGGVNGGGTVYELSPSGSGWTFTTIYSFVGGYGGPYNKLTLDTSGNLYGFTNAEGANGLGSIFKLAPGSGGWTLTNLHDFAGGSDGGSPYGSVAVDAKGNVFGTAVVGGSDNQGVVFEITQ